MACLVSIGESLRRVSKVNNVLQKSNAAAARVFEMMDLPVERAAHAAKTSASSGPRSRQARIQAPAAPARASALRTSRSAYPNTNQPARRRRVADRARRAIVAVVGRNGSGKTTLLALLPRFYDPQQRPRDDRRRRHARRHAAQPAQADQHRHAGLGDLPRHHRREHRLRPAAGDAAIDIDRRRGQARAFAHEFILEKPQGYDTLLGELGGQLSGGQKQRSTSPARSSAKPRS